MPHDNSSLEITKADILLALGDIEEQAPELIEYIVSYYPPELMIHVSPEICQRLEALKRLSFPPENSGS